MDNEERKRPWLKSGLVQGASYIAFSAVLFIQSRQLGFDSGLVPRITLGLLVILGIALIVKSIRSSDPKPVDLVWRPEIIRRSVVVVIVALTFWLAIQSVGFYVSTCLLFLFFYFFFDPRCSLTNLVLGVGYSLSSTLFLYYIFYTLMRVITPSGLLI